jgi:hypothetical protein
MERTQPGVVEHERRELHDRVLSDVWQEPELRRSSPDVVPPERSTVLPEGKGGGTTRLVASRL